MHGNGSVRTVDGGRGEATPRSLLAAVAVLVLALAASCGGASGGQQPAEGSGGDAPAEEQAGRIEPLGEANAPVVLTEYGDYK